MIDHHALGASLRNWGRWGADDERGTVNFITAAKVLEAAQLVKKGAVFDLGMTFDAMGPQTGANNRINPVHLMVETGQDQDAFGGGFHYADDYVTMPLQCSTQWDALAHVWYDDQLYNGYDAATTVTPHGAHKNSITAMAKGIAGRAVLLDMARLAGVEWLPSFHTIMPEDLDRAAEAQGVTIGEGDILLLRTGFGQKFKGDADRAVFIDEHPGIGLECCQWLYDHSIAALAADTYAIEVQSADPDYPMVPVHQVCLRDMGMTFGEMFDLDELAADCAEDGQWDVMLAAPPLKVTGAVGSPLNPLAFK